VLDALQIEIAERQRGEGLALVASTRLHGRNALRFCTINPRTTEDDLRRTLEDLARIGAAILLERGPRGPGLTAGAA
jgi:glutamate/tyrosine decarboxylase-like PLP-dependent enzyme